MFQLQEVITANCFLFFLQALLFTVAIIVQSGNQADYDSDDEYIVPRSGIRQPLVNQQQGAADPRVPNLDYRPIRNDAWSQRMREKVQDPFLAAITSIALKCFLPFAYIGILCCGSMGWIASIRTGFNRPRYHPQNKETDVQFSEAWLISASSGSKFIPNCAITSTPGWCVPGLSDVALLCRTWRVSLSPACFRWIAWSELHTSTGVGIASFRVL